MLDLTLYFALEAAVFIYESRGDTVVTGKDETQEWSFSVPDDGNVFPKDLAETVWSFLQWSQPDRFLRRPRSEAQLLNLVLPTFQASLASEEGRLVRFQGVFDPKIKKLTTKFANSISFSANQLVKLSPTIGLQSRWLVVSPQEGSDDVHLVGIVDPGILLGNRTMQKWGGLSSSQDEFQGLRFAVHGPGWLRLSTFIESFELRNCCLRRRLVIGGIKYVREWFIEAASLFGVNDVPAAAAVSKRFFVQMLAKISEASHGGCVLVVPDGANISSMPLKIKYEVNSDVIQAVIKERSVVGPKAFLKGGPTGKDGPAEIIRDDSTVVDSLLLNRDLANVTEFTAKLASVDGAVLISRDFKLHGFGAEITLTGTPSAEETVEYGNHPSPLGKPDDARLLDFGMRHRSAARFCQSVPSAMAFVVSQDGGIRMFCNVDGKVRQFVELSAEEW